MKRQAFCAITLLFCTAACGGGGGGGGGSSGGGGGPAPSDPRLGRLDVYEGQKLRVLGNPAIGAPGLPVTAPQDVPARGVADFTGSATIRVEGGTGPLVLFGDAAVSVDLTGNTTTGRLDAFFGTVSSGAVVDYSGAINVAGSQAEQDMAIGFTGTLTGGGSRIALNGSMQAMLLDTPVSAIAASDLNAVANVDGNMRDATIIVVGEGAVVVPSDPMP